MARFVKKLMEFFCLLIVGALGIVALKYIVVGSQYQKTYMGAFVDKIERLKSINEPKIILVGNSNVAFGFDSERIEKAMGMPVVNLGYLGDVGSAFNEDMAKFSINSGDIVVLCHSGYNSEDRIFDRVLAWSTIDNHIESLRVLRPKDYIPMLEAYPCYYRKTWYSFFLNKSEKDPGGSYCRAAFNKYGDISVKNEASKMDAEAFFSSKAKSPKDKKTPEFNTDNIKRVNEYNRYISKRGATLVIAGYPIAYGRYSIYDQEYYRQYQEELEALVECEVISDFTEYMFPYDYFFDTAVHLTTEGAAKRSDVLISDLKKWMADKT